MCAPIERKMCARSPPTPPALGVRIGAPLREYAPIPNKRKWAQIGADRRIVL
jgi:hypothetical protein